MSHLLNSPAFTGTPTAPTATTGDSSTTIATTAFVKAQNYLTSAVTAVSIATANGFSGSSSGGNTPALTIVAGAITPTSVNGLTLAAATNGFTIAGGTTSKTFTCTNTLTLSGTDGSTLNIGTGGTLGTAAFTAASTYQTVANLSTSTSLGTSDTLYPSQNAVKAYVDASVVGLLDDRGNYDASVNTYPASGGSGAAGAIMKGDIWYVSVAGTLGGTAVGIGSSVRALTNTPGQTAGNWDIIDGPAITSQTASNLLGGAAGTVVYQSAVNTSAFLTAGTTSQVLIGGASAPSWSNTPTLTGTNFTGIPQAGVTNLTTDLSGKAATNQTMYIGSSGVAINAITGTFTTIAGMTSITSTTFVGALTGNASTSTSLAGGGANTVVYQSAAGTTAFLTNAAGVLTSSGSAAPTWSTTPTLTGTNFTGIPQSAVTSLTTDLSGKAPLASPTFTGTPAAPTAAVDTNTTQLATTAFVIAQASSTTPIMDGAAAVGSETKFARGNHVHPSDTTKAPLASPTFTGTPAAPTAAVGTNTTQVATTAYVLAAVSAPTVAIATKTGAYTVLGTDYCLLGDATTAGFAFTLPAAPTTGEIHVFKKIDSSTNAVTVNGNSKNIDGASTISLSAQYQSWTLVYNGTAWFAL